MTVKKGRDVIKYWLLSSRIFVPLGFIELFGGDFGLVTVILVNLGIKFFRIIDETIILGNHKNHFAK